MENGRSRLSGPSVVAFLVESIERLLLRQVRPHLFDDGVEGGGVGDGEFAEHLAVEGDAGGGGGGDEAVVGDAALAQGCVQAGDPEGAEVALLLAAVAVG